ncbi:sensor histidine kinase [Microbacterium fluvii]|uniref:histidine kinase n=1 Tax=Microbacterium fluvii TaxID=415215 RepID=A0ABW2HE56_9MICO|nr:histidine kinase [Microbacterium fluvii]MCU4672439.1 histidine kinase [Microbacterium fluvii]
MTSTRARLGSRWEEFFDLVGGVTLAGVVGMQVINGRPLAPHWAAAVLLLTSVALLVVRRRAPLEAAGGSVITSALALLFPQTALVVWVLAEVCLFSVPLRRSRGATVVVGSAHAAVLYLGAPLAFGVPLWDPVALALPVWTGAVMAFGTALRTQQDHVDSLEEQARTSAAVRESEVLRRVGAERLHIARDLHDSVANSLAVINLESTNARRHLEDDPQRSRRSLEVIRAVTRSTIGELADILTVLRETEDDSDRTLATAANIPRVIELLARSGRRIEASLGALETARLDPLADAALFRVAQESLTNAHRHGAGDISISAETDVGMVTLTVANDLASPLERSGESGFGLVGMRERVELAGGSIQAGLRDGRFVVRARLPLTPGEKENP